VVSGLAEGVDTEAHQSCLAVGGRTIAVLGTGLDVTYPWFNRDLSRRISQQGLLVSEHPIGTQPDRSNFPRRNRIIAGLCRATLIIEAPPRSGALITARMANEYGRDVYVLPGSLDNYRAKGCLELLNQGAHVILGEKELLSLLETLPQLHPMQLPQSQLPQSQHSTLPLLPNQLTLLQADPPLVQSLDPDLQGIIQAIRLEPTPLDQIVQQTGLPTARILSGLSQLELMGLVSQLPGMRYQRG
jgi:DNA processing protein